tara:strand:- start:53 stop:1087 length:1035 start_codon:yes stop_codon:yes gene_type:complete
MSINLEKYKDKGLTGLANLGNTCYINSCMQILSHSYNLNEILDNDNIMNKLNNIDDSILLVEWKKLKDLMWSKNCTISPNRYINIIQKISQKKDRQLFSGFAQNDLPEFLIFLIECFHNSLKRKVNMNIVGNAVNETDNLAKKCYAVIKNMYSETYSEILNLYYGIHISQIHSSTNLECLSINPEPYCLINLPIPENTNTCTIYDCFDTYTTKEYLEGDNAWYNESTKQKENIYKSLIFWSFPDILIVDFKRFTNSNKKINTVISTPTNNLNLSKYVVGYDKDSYIYELFGVCNHSGGCLGGHYTSFVKNANNKWYHFNDTHISEISEDNIITNKGYCYFYKKQ